MVLVAEMTTMSALLKRQEVRLIPVTAFKTSLNTMLKNAEKNALNVCVQHNVLWEMQPGLHPWENH